MLEIFSGLICNEIDNLNQLGFLNRLQRKPAITLCNHIHIWFYQITLKIYRHDILDSF